MDHRPTMRSWIVTFACLLSVTGVGCSDTRPSLTYLPQHLGLPGLDAMNTESATDTGSITLDGSGEDTIPAPLPDGVNGDTLMGQDTALAADASTDLGPEEDTTPADDTGPEEDTTPVEDTKPVVLDTDGDGVLDAVDNCKDIPNADQADLDGDLEGDACDDDDDGDGVVDVDDNCPVKANKDQKDGDGDQIGDVCDQDSDGDGIANGDDNCPENANPDQMNSDQDAKGDACDKDDDGDGTQDDDDCAPLDATINPDASEICDGQDNNCDDKTDNLPLCLVLNCDIHVLEGVVFQFCFNYSNWWGALDQCETQGGSLASIESKEEHAAIKAIAQSSQASRYWIGINDLDDEGKYEWSNGAKVDFDLWNNNQPDDAQNNEDCGEILDWFDWNWNDFTCWTPQPFICRFD